MGVPRPEKDSAGRACYSTQGRPEPRSAPGAMFWRSPGFVQASPVEVRVVLPVFRTCTRARVPPCTLRHRASHLRHSLTTLSPPNPRRLGPQLVLDKESFTLEELLEEDDVIQECKSLNSRLIDL